MTWSFEEYDQWFLQNLLASFWFIISIRSKFCPLRANTQVYRHSALISGPQATVKWARTGSLFTTLYSLPCTWCSFLSVIPWKPHELEPRWILLVEGISYTNILYPYLFLPQIKFVYKQYVSFLGDSELSYMPLLSLPWLCTQLHSFVFSLPKPITVVHHEALSQTSDRLSCPNGLPKHPLQYHLFLLALKSTKAWLSTFCL